MKQISRGRLIASIAGLSLVTTAGVVANGFSWEPFQTAITPFVVAVDNRYELKPLLSVGDRVPETSDPANKEFQMVGIPDGMGAHSSGRWDQFVTVYMNHEFGTTNTPSEVTIGEPLNRGAFVSKIILDRRGRVISGERAYDTVYLDDTLVGPAAAIGNTTPGFGRFCSGHLAGPKDGFDRYIYFANEEVSAPGTFDGKGGLSVAVFDNEAHALTYLGRFPWENTLVQPNTGKYTVIMGMEDGPANLDPAGENSQLYMYVGEKSHKKNATVLERNGLVGGYLYVFKAKDPTKNSELPFQEGTIDGEWVWIPNANTMTQAQLEAASDAAGAMRFGRPEDGAFNPRNSDEYFFVTTGESTGANVLGRLYSLRLNAKGATKPAKLTVLVNSDQILKNDPSADTVVSPDNIDVSRDYLMINEDGTGASRAVMAAKGRDGSIWRYKLTKNGLDPDSAQRVVQLNPPGRDAAHPIGAGVWETTGIIESTDLFGFWPFGLGRLFGEETWLFNVQAHPPTVMPQPNTVEDGQLVLMIRNQNSRWLWNEWWD